MGPSKDLVRHGWKLASLLIAFLFWRNVLGERQLIREFEVPVTLESLSPNLALIGKPPTTLRVRVKATDPVIKDLTPADIEARVDLADFHQGTRLYRFRPEKLRVPYGVEVVSIDPAQLPITLERKLTTLVPVECQVTGRAADGYELKRVETSPARVEITGPESAVRAVDLVVTETVSIEGRRSSMSRELEIHIDNEDVWIVGNLRVAVRLVIDEVIAERTFSRIPIGVSSAAFDSSLKPAAADVTLEGPRSLIQTLAPEDIEASVDLAGLEPARASYQLPVSIGFKREQLRERIRVKKVSRQTVDVRIYNRKTEPKQDERTNG